MMCLSMYATRLMLVTLSGWARCVWLLFSPPAARSIFRRSPHISPLRFRFARSLHACGFATFPLRALLPGNRHRRRLAVQFLANVFGTRVEVIHETAQLFDRFVINPFSLGLRRQFCLSQDARA